MDDTKAPILTAVDFSPHSEAALVWAAHEAAAHGLPLVVLHVVHDPVHAPGYYHVADSLRGEPDQASPSERIEETAARLLADFLRGVQERHGAVRALGDLQTHMVIGLPETRIVEVAREIGACHIVMGSQGRTGLQHLLVGSKAQRVVQLAPVPVTIVKAPPGEEVATP